MPSTMTPTIRELSPDAARALLRTHDVGRIAYAWHGQVDIEPIHYVYDDEEDALYARTSPGAKLLTLRHNPWVAFEVDEVHGRYTWRSVVAHGTVYELHASGTPADRRAHARALELLRAHEPTALTPDDPAPSRTVLFQISVDRLHAREATSDSGEARHAGDARADSIGRWRSP
jgi:uncharacterized protein